MRALFITSLCASVLLAAAPAWAELPVSPAKPAPAAAPVPVPEPNPRRPEPKAPPLQPLPAEAAYRAKVKAMIAPLLAIAPTPEELAALTAALKANAPTGLTDAIAQKLVTWHAMMAGIGEPDTFITFAKANPAWPGSQTLDRRAEEQLFNQGGSSARIRAFFKGREPTDGTGWAALASAYLAEGDQASATKYAAKAWTEADMAASFETGFLDRFGKLLTVDDHKRRLDRLLVDRVRYRAERRERATVARRVIKLLPDAERKEAETRLLVFLGNKAAIRSVIALPHTTAGKTDWGLAYAHAIAHLQANRLADAAKILTDLPTDSDKLVSPDDWWLARREAAYDAIKAGKPDLAYKLVRQSTPLSENPAKEQAHMAGWIALQLNKKPALALKHFEAHMAAADGPLSRARSRYWTGRALEALGRKPEAMKRYQEALSDPDTFHALLARHKLAGSRRLDFDVKPPALPTPAELKQFLARDSVRAAVLAVRAGLPRNISMGLFAATRNHLNSEGELALLAELASSLGDPQTALRIGKSAIARGHNLILYGYPIEAWPDFKPLGVPPETAMLLAVARQETEFNTAIVSSAGARGLLQVMPITARHVCQDHKLKCEISRLLTDHGYNAMIGSAYIGDRMREFGGWYVVTLAGYNAGPGRARQWIRENGDPRTAGVDSIDWIERIPIEETRNYVQKVLSNIQIYRARLGEPKPVRLLDDLHKATDIRRAAAD